MVFRPHNKRKRQQHLAFQTWLEANQDLVARSGLPASVTQSRDDWAYFLLFGYHDHGNWNTAPLTWIDFTWDELAPEQQEIVRALETSWKAYLGRYPILGARIPAQKED
jgi:hypothetical protein